MVARKTKKQPDPKPEKLLFNLAEDIGEQHNLYESNLELAGKLKSRMIAVDDEITENARPVWRLPDSDDEASK